MRKILLHLCRDYALKPESMWPVVADLSGYAEHVTGLKSSDVLEGQKLGALRRCVTVKDETWTETVSEWIEGERYEIEVDTDTYPFPLRQLFRRFTGIWTVTSTTAGTNVCITFLPDVRGGWFVWPLVKLGARQSIRDIEFTLESYERAALERFPEASSDA